MSAIRSALDEWVGEDLEHLSLEQLGDDLVGLELVSGMLEVERLRRINSFELRSGPDRFGYPSPTAFLKDRCRMAAGRAHRLVARARALARAHATFSSWREGRLSTDQAMTLLDHASAVPAEFGEAESKLIGIVADLGVFDTRRALDYWRQSVDGPGNVKRSSEQEALRGISTSTIIGGMLRVDGWMTPVAGQALLSALDALMPPPDTGDDRTPRQRRHDALEDLARDFLDHFDTPQIGGEKPHINVVCDLPALQGITGGIHETEDGNILTIGALHALSCDCSLSRIVLGPDSEIIDVGRRARVIPAALRRAIIARDRHCTWLGCDRSPRWCDGHHIRHWADGGPTEPGNLRLLCRFHHTLLHRAADPGRHPPGENFP